MAIDLAVLATTVVTKFLYPYVKEGVERIAEKVGAEFGAQAAEHAVGLSRSLWERVKGLFTSDKEQAKVELFEEDPESYGQGLIKALQAKLEDEPRLAEELAKLVESPAPDGSGTGAQIMNATVAGIVDLRGGTVSGGTVTGAYVGSIDKPEGAGPNVPRG